MFWTQVRYRGGVHLPSIDLWLDPHGRREWAFISHAHSDHIAAHDTVMLSEGTFRFVCQRGMSPRQAVVLPFGEARDIEGVRFTLHPAGHILGSAQLLAEVDDRRILYSGDFKLRANHAAERIAIPRADVLIMETTFGNARYRFPPEAETIAAMAAWCDNCLTDGVVPVLLGYSLGKGQEILAALDGHGYRFLLHDALYRTTRLAEELGAVFPPYAFWTPEEGATFEPTTVVLCPPHLRKWIKPKLPPARFAIISGWAADPRARYRYGTEAAFCLSDHADYPDLLDYVAQVQPTRVYTVHGHAAEFAGDLRRRGYDASALDEADQLELF